jgi:N-acetylmuramic acid 6-phosphate etherase
MDLSKLITEQRNPNTMTIDELDAYAIVTLINQEDARVAAAVELTLYEIAALVDAATGALSNGGRLIYVGAGTSGRLGVLDASECPPTFGADPRQIVGVIAGGERALRHSVEGADLIVVLDVDGQDVHNGGWGFFSHSTHPTMDARAGTCVSYRDSLGPGDASPRHNRRALTNRL